MDDPVAVAVADAQLPGMPLVHTNAAFDELTGYRAAEVLGLNCRLLQGAETEPAAVATMVGALRGQKPCDVTLINYRKDGRSFVNLLSLRPVLDAASGRMRFVVATLREQSQGCLASSYMRDDIAALLLAIPSTVRCSTPVPQMPSSAKTYTAGHGATARPTASQEVRGSDSGSNDDAPGARGVMVNALTPLGSLPKAMTAAAADGCWVGAPVRHHVAALRSLLRLPSSPTQQVSGSELLVTFLRSHWQRNGRLDSEADLTLDVQLSLHSKNLMRDVLEHVVCMVEVNASLTALQPGAHGRGAFSGEDRMMKMFELYTNTVKAERARGGRPRKMQRGIGRALLAAAKSGGGMLATAASLKQREAKAANADAERAEASLGGGRASGDEGEGGKPGGLGSNYAASEAGDSRPGSRGGSRAGSRRPSRPSSPTGSDDAKSDGGQSVGGMSCANSVAASVMGLNRAPSVMTSDSGGETASNPSGNIARRGSYAGSNTDQSSEAMLDAIEGHCSMLHHLLVFDVWVDLLHSPSIEAIQTSLASSHEHEQQQLARMIGQCVRSLPVDTDGWIRLFISSVSELDQVGVLVCDATLPSCPILSSNTGFELMTGYSREDVVGRNCRFMQGAKSDEGSIHAIRHAVQTGSQAHVKLINYRKDGTVFLNMLSLRPLMDVDGGYRFMVSISVEVSLPP
jgi:PAS domain S-box-containing protein